MALVCLAISGLCDMFDGKVARTKKDRTEAEKRFGIQIDSLADIVCFGVSPAILCYRMGMRGLTGVGFLLFYVLAGLISAMGIWRHHTNIKRLLSGTENKLGARKE